MNHHHLFFLVSNTDPIKNSFQVKFVDFLIEHDYFGDCSFDRLSISESSKDHGHYCGSNVPPPIETQGNQITIVFHSNGQSTAPGWKMTWADSDQGICISYLKHYFYYNSLTHIDQS